MNHKEFVVMVKKSIESDFVRFLAEKEKGITAQVRKRYVSEMDKFVSNYVDGNELVIDFSNLFEKQRIKKFLEKVTGSTARASLNNYLKCLLDNEKIGAEKFLQVKESINSIKVSPGEKLDFLTESDLTKILNGIDYRKKKDEEARIKNPLITALAYHMLFEQVHLIKLTWDDIDLEKRKIRNLRHDDDNLVCEWIEIDDFTLEKLLEYREYSKNLSGTFLIIDGSPANNSSITKMLSIYKLKRNAIELTTTVDIQKLVRSRILQELKKSSGASLCHFFRIMGLKSNTQLQHALAEYLAFE